MTSLVSQLRADFPDLNFEVGEQYAWQPQTKTIRYLEPANPAQLLHELGHALLGHTDYSLDINLLEMERDAWATARVQAVAYDVSLSDDEIQTDLDSYRDWLHSRSSCPACQSTGIQTKAGHYRCLACTTTWRVNDSRICGLRRYVIKK